MLKTIPFVTGAMDYKTLPNGSVYDDAGNYNYGFVCRCGRISKSEMIQRAIQAKLATQIYHGSINAVKSLDPQALARQVRGEYSDKIELMSAGWEDANKDLAAIQDLCARIDITLAKRKQVHQTLDPLADLGRYFNVPGFSP